MTHSPPMLQSARKTSSTPHRSAALGWSAIEKTPCPHWTEGESSRYHLWFTAPSRGAALRGPLCRPPRCIGRTRRSLLGRKRSFRRWVRCSGRYSHRPPLPFPPARGSLGRGRRRYWFPSSRQGALYREKKRLSIGAAIPSAGGLCYNLQMKCHSALRRAPPFYAPCVFLRAFFRYHGSRKEEHTWTRSGSADL